MNRALLALALLLTACSGPSEIDDTGTRAIVASSLRRSNGRATT